MDMRTNNLIDYLSAAEALEKAHKETDSVMVYLKNGAYRLIKSNAKKGAKQPKAPEPCDVIRVLKGEYLKDFDKTIELYEKKYESFRQLKGSNLL